ncbi:type II toxin-antitoxin system HipA family toxin [Duganella sp. FT135W]|uniref:Type II toxin-antitoxin system HipA family toxin n=1 Tax=Duganella flavida TaxID=2692175 RepID=A0A6L8KHG1_9BURK|nr:HipA domain-containing protein [Duganella flavida]MYM26480.1 type II toxin-antitoxin system HipA family toxin [Duganella flavida]
MSTSSHLLCLWMDKRLIADIEYAPVEERWSLRYSADWLADPDAFPLSPAMSLSAEIASGTVRRFLENLLPEGHALDIVASSQGIAKSNVFGLIHALGAETTGAFRFLPQSVDGTLGQPAIGRREISLAELDQRIADRAQRPLIEWDGKLRMSVAGYQDKLLVCMDGGSMYLPDFPLASTHILKPQPAEERLPYMVANEHFCMTLAAALGLPAAPVAILRTPRPVLAVTRFDRTIVPGGEVRVVRKHIIDACQAADLPVSFKYERNIGSVGDAALYRDGVSLPVLFGLLEFVNRKAVDKLAMLRWALFQLVIGNSDAHGKNFSFFVHRTGLQAAPWYDLVSVVQYPQFSHELAMAFGDQFNLDQVRAFDLADFAQRCGIDRQLLLRECRRLRDGVQQHALALAAADLYQDGERELTRAIAEFAIAQAGRLCDSAQEAIGIADDLL